MVNNGLSFLVSVCFTDAHGVWLYADEAPFTVWTKTVDLKKKNFSCFDKCRTAVVGSIKKKIIIMHHENKKKTSIFTQFKNKTNKKKPSGQKEKTTK